MKLIYERAGESARMLEPLDVPALRPADGMTRKTELKLPRVAESEMSRHYAKLGRAAFGVCDGFYPLGSCTMKYNPKVNEAMAALPGFTDAHPTQDAPGCAHALALAKEYLTEITGMDDMTFEPCAGAHGEFTSMLMVRAYHLSRGDHGRTKIIVPIRRTAPIPPAPRWPASRLCRWRPRRTAAWTWKRCARLWATTPPLSCSQTPTRWVCLTKTSSKSPALCARRAA